MRGFGNDFKTAPQSTFDNSVCKEGMICAFPLEKTSKEISLYEPIGTDREGNEIKLYDIIETDEDDIPERVCLKENIQKLYEKVENELSQREKLVLKMRYGLYGGEEYTQREVAKQLGISRSYVSRIEKSAVEKLRVFFCSS